MGLFHLISYNIFLSFSIGFLPIPLNFILFLCNLYLSNSTQFCESLRFGNFSLSLCHNISPSLFICLSLVISLFLSICYFQSRSLPPGPSPITIPHFLSPSLSLSLSLPLSFSSVASFISSNF